MVSKNKQIYLGCVLTNTGGAQKSVKIWIQKKACAFLLNSIAYGKLGQYLLQEK